MLHTWLTFSVALVLVLYASTNLYRSVKVNKVIEKKGENEPMVSERSEHLVKTAECIKTYMDKQEQCKAHYE